LRIELHEVGRQYIEERLRISGPLGLALLARCVLFAGRVFALVPDGSAHDLSNFNTGGLILDDWGSRALPVADRSRAPSAAANA
jgi:hypothetical protein